MGDLREHRGASGWGLVAAASVLPGCWFFGGGGGGTGPTDAMIDVAVGAEVTVALERFCDGDMLSVCTPYDPESVVDVGLSGEGFEVVSSRYDDQERRVLVTVRALEPGDALLRVEYTDLFDDVRTVRVGLSALEMTHVELLVGCEGSDQEGAGYPVGAGAGFYFNARAMAGETPLASGQLALVEDYAGFEITTVPDVYHRATAPTTAGRYTWLLAGVEAREVDFIVYPPGDLQLAVSELPGSDPTLPRVRVEGVVGGVPVCVHGADTRVVISATGAACWPLISGFEIVGPLPIDLAGGAVDLPLAGQGDCTVEAALDGGTPVAVTVAVDNLLPPPERGTDLALSPTPLEVGGEPRAESACDDALTDGNCDGYDGDCLVDSDWVISHHDGTQGSDSEILNGEPTGVGLTSELRLLVELDFVTIGLAEGPPVDLAVTPSPATGLGFSSPGCRSEDDSMVLRLAPATAGSYDLELRAGNIDDVGGFTVQARDVTAVQFATREADDEAAGASDVFYFPGSTTDVSVGYLSGGTAVRGVAPIRVSASDAAGGATITADGERLSTGDRPQTITLASTRALQTQTVRVVDQTGISGVGDFPAETVYLGLFECFEPYPSTGSGRRIHGVIPARPRLSLTGDALTVEMRPFEGQMCLHGFAAGSTVVEVGWGAAVAQQTWQVQGI